MATEEQREQRLFCVGEKIVVMEGEEIIKFLQIDEEEIKQKVLQQIKKKKEEGQAIEPIFVFTDALEEITRIPFKHRGYKMSVTNLSIHESSLYRKMLEFICKKMNFTERIEQQRIANEKRRREKAERGRIYSTTR